MTKLTIIIILFYSTSIFADLWEERPLDFNLNFYIIVGWKIEDIRKNELKENYDQYTYFLTHPEDGFRICQVWFNSDQPEMTKCFKEKNH